MNKRGLLLIVGECFREGSQHSRLRDTEYGFYSQKMASDSHMQLIKQLENDGYLIDTMICTYQTKYESELKTWYHPNTEFIFQKELIGIEGLINQGIWSIEKETIDQYDFLFILRIDLFLKPLFFRVFQPSHAKIMFPFICWKRWYRHIDSPRVAGMMEFIPRRYLSQLSNCAISMEHETWHIYNEYYGWNADDMGFFIDTFHDADSGKDYNPLYKTVSRPETNIWHSGPLYRYQPTIHDLSEYEKIEDTREYTDEDCALIYSKANNF